MLAACLSAAACTRSQPPPPPAEPVTLTVGVPQVAGLGTDRSIVQLAQGYANERLTSYDGSGRTAGRIVEAWSATDGRRTWRLTMRRGVVFHDGTPLTADDLRKTILEFARDPQVVSVCLPDLQSVTVEGERDIVLRLAQPCYFLPDDIDAEIGRTGKDGKTVGTGPFRPVQLSEAVVTMEANPLYYRGKPEIERLVLRAYSTLRAPWAEMMRGGVDFLQDLGPDSAEFLRNQSTIEIRTSPALKLMALMLNLDRRKFKPVEVRQALNFAVDRGELVRQGLKGQGRPMDVPVWPALWAFDAAAPGIPFDPDRARAILGTQQRPLAFTCLIPDNYAVQERLALLLRRQLQAVGVDMRIEAVPPETFMARMETGNWEATVLDPLGGPYLPILYRFWHSPAPSRSWNTFGYRDAAVDTALDAMKTAGDDEAVRLAFARFVAAMRANPPAIVLMCPNRSQAISRRFEAPAGEGDPSRTFAAWRLREPAR